MQLSKLLAISGIILISISLTIYLTTIFLAPTGSTQLNFVDGTSTTIFTNGLNPENFMFITQYNGKQVISGTCATFHTLQTQYIYIRFLCSCVISFGFATIINS